MKPAGSSESGPPVCCSTDRISRNGLEVIKRNLFSLHIRQTKNSKLREEQIRKHEGFLRKYHTVWWVMNELSNVSLSLSSYIRTIHAWWNVAGECFCMENAELVHDLSPALTQTDVWYEWFTGESLVRTERMLLSYLYGLLWVINNCSH